MCIAECGSCLTLPRAAIALCSDIVGFRAPYLSTDENVRKVLAANKFLYDR